MRSGLTHATTATYAKRSNIDGPLKLNSFPKNQSREALPLGPSAAPSPCLPISLSPCPVLARLPTVRHRVVAGLPTVPRGPTAGLLLWPVSDRATRHVADRRIAPCCGRSLDRATR